MKSKLWKIKELKRGDFNFTTPVNSLLEKLLISRCRSQDDLKDFLEDKEILHDPFLLPDMEKAVKRVWEAVDRGETICIYGDYDCDGVCATSILTDYLQNVGGRVFYYIPNREKEGYGMNIPAIDFIKTQGAGLILTVDNGITAMDEIKYASSLGIDTVVTDHHTPRDTLPESVANVNPHLSDSKYPFKEICGTVVAFKLACAMEGERGFELMEQYGDLLAIATIGDVMELRNENRYIVKKGVELIKEGHREGITQLLKKAGIKEFDKINSETVGFSLCPRINAAGRIDSPDYPVMLFLSEGTEETEELASYLDGLNSKRKEEEAKIIDDIGRFFAENPSVLQDKIMVLAGEGWNPGVVGIVASRLTERFSRPCLVTAITGDTAKGSGRSIEGFSLIKAITECSRDLTHFGGHPMAAGFSIPTDKIDDFRKMLNSYEKENPIPNCYLDVDFSVEPSELNVENVRSMAVLEPFGTGNPSPVMMMEKVEVIREYPLSGGRHTKYRVRKNNTEYNLICFNMLFDMREAKSGDIIDVAFTPNINSWQGRQDVDMLLVSMKPSCSDYEKLYNEKKSYDDFKLGKSLPQDVCPERNETAVLYKFLRVRRMDFKNPYWEYERYKEKLNLSYIKFLLSIDILKELGTIKEDERGYSHVIPNAPKCDFKSSSTVRRFS